TSDLPGPDPPAAFDSVHERPTRARRYTGRSGWASGVAFGSRRRGDLADGLHLVHLFRRELKAELLFHSQHEIQILNGVPRLDGLGGGVGSEHSAIQLEKVRRDASNPFEDWFVHAMI